VTQGASDDLREPVLAEGVLMECRGGELRRPDVSTREGPATPVGVENLDSPAWGRRYRDRASVRRIGVLVFFFFLHMLVRRLLRLVAGTSATRALEVENAVLRHQLAVLRRGKRTPRLRRRDRVLLAAASSVLPRESWEAFVVSPHTLLRWHRELVRRRWTYRGETDHPGRSSCARRPRGCSRATSSP
jgi:hypothetical protein